MRTLGARLVRGAAFLIDYGFPEHEYYHVQRHMGTVMCHRAHQADADPLVEVGQTDRAAPWAVERTVAYLTSIGKKPIVVKDVPGFFMTRFVNTFRKAGRWTMSG